MSQYQRISCTDAKALIDSKDVNIIDIRDEKTFNGGHITDAEHIDNTSIAEFINDTDHATAVIVCCYHGNSSQSAGAYLAEQGFEEVYSLDGGYEQWASAYPDDCEVEHNSF